MIIRSGEPIFVGFTPEGMLVSIKLLIRAPGGVGGGGGTELYRYMSPHRVGFMRRFGLKTGIHFPHFGLESGMVWGELRECFFIQFSNNLTLCPTISGAILGVQQYNNDCLL